MTDRLTRALEDLVRGVDGEAGIYARRLDDGREVTAGVQDHRFPTGSAAKALVLAAYALAVDAEEIDPHRRVAVDSTYQAARPGSGVLRHLEPGLSPTLEDCAALMMIVSDNVATDLVLDALGGPDGVNGRRGELGDPDVEITSPTVWVAPPGQFAMATPAGLASVWERWHATDAVAQRCRRITWRQQHREGFGRLVPFSPDLIDFGLQSPLGLWSKPGSYPTVSCEGGLFECDGASWVLAVMAEGLADWGNHATSVGPALRAEASKLVYERWRPPE